MMKKLCILFLALSCSGVKEPVKIKNDITQDTVNQCLSYRNDVLNKSLIVSGKKSIFIQDIPYVRESFYQFKNNQKIRDTHGRAAQQLIDSCNEENLKSFHEIAQASGKCDLSFYELNYFQALGDALKNEVWPLDVRLEGKKLALDYAKHFAKGEYLLVDRLIAITVLYELSIKSIIDAKVAPIAKESIQQIYIQLKQLEEQSVWNKNLNCENLNILKKEVELSQDARLQLESLLKLI